MSLQARDECSGADIGVLCVGHLNGTILHPQVDTVRVIDDGDFYGVTDGAKDGVVVRLNNPTGIIRAQSNTNYFYPIRLLDFFARNFTYSDANITETVNGYSLYFPTFTIQTTAMPSIDRGDGTHFFVPKAFARVGFYSASGSFSNPATLSDGTTVITATAESNAAQQTIQIETSAQSTAPFFNFAVFQQ